ncbi:MAG: hypothetical protein KC420_07495 [Myxococcales bacterium]|nr:hypothetical protein [Myxococcales bacterium]
MLEGPPVEPAPVVDVASALVLEEPEEPEEPALVLEVEASPVELVSASAPVMALVSELSPPSGPQAAARPTTRAETPRRRRARDRACMVRMVVDAALVCTTNSAPAAAA